MLKDADPQIRSRAATFILANGSAVAEDLFLALADPSRHQRVEIARLLRRLGLPGVILSRFVVSELQQAYRFLEFARILASLPTGPVNILLREYLVEKQADNVEITLYALGTLVFGEGMGNDYPGLCGQATKTSGMMPSKLSTMPCKGISAGGSFRCCKTNPLEGKLAAGKPFAKHLTMSPFSPCRCIVGPDGGKRSGVA